jgi:hypothetical protein
MKKSKTIILLLGSLFAELAEEFVTWLVEKKEE